MKHRFKNMISTLCMLALPLGPAIAEKDLDDNAAENIGQTANEAIKEQFKYSFNDVFTNLVTISCKSAAGRSAGSGFIAKMDGKTYLFTNQHVILGADKIRFKSTSGEVLKPRSVELSGSRDIARLLLKDRDDALEMASDIGMDIPIGVFGNSEGAGVATELYGKVTGIGADLIEVTAEFISGNSGSPVLNVDKEVIGIASYVSFSRPSRMKAGTQFENKTRRFCYRIQNSEWMSVKWKPYNQNYGAAYTATEQFILYLSNTFQLWGVNPLSSIEAKNRYGQAVHYWAKSHNNLLEKKRNGKSHHFREEYRDSTKRLGKLCVAKAEQLRTLSEQRDISGFLRNEFERQAMTLELLNDICIFYGDQIFR